MVESTGEGGVEVITPEERNLAKQKYKMMTLPLGVYQIKNNANGKLYIQSGKDPKSKLNRERFQLKWGGHPNRQLQKDWQEYGAENFTFEILELVEPQENGEYSKEALQELEAKWLEELQPYGEQGYN